jgi:hypothetical protein
VLVETGPVLGFGWTVLRRGVPAEPAAIAVQAFVDPDGRAVLDNGIVRVEVDPGDGTFSLAVLGGPPLAGLNRYVDGGDGGDTYTWCPPGLDTVVDRPRAVSCEVEEGGPLRGRMAISATYDWPVGADGDANACTGRTAETAAVTVRTSLSLVAGDPVVGVEGTVDNRCRDHRLRAHFPLPEAADGSDAGCAFAVVHRGLEAEAGPPESPPPTFPARRFVTAGGLAVIADGAFEYAVTDGGRELAVTLLRATGWLSRRRLALRPDPAGPALAVEGAQVQGPRRWRYGLLVHRGDWEAAALPRHADAFLEPLEAVAAAPAARADAVATLPSVGRALPVEGAEVSAVTRDGAGMVLRLFHPGARPVTARVAGQPVDLRPGEIAVVRPSRRPGVE